MQIALDVLATVAVLSTGVIFGTDVLGAVVMRPALAEIDDYGLVQVTGRTHRYGDSRLPFVGILSVVSALATALVAFVAGEVAAGVIAAAGLAPLLIWLLLFARISAPINRVLTAAALADETPANARQLQARWDSIINLRAVLQGLAVAAFCVAISVS